MKIGHAHLKVRDLERAISFYEEFLGLEVVERVGNSYAFLTSGEMHHEIALQNAGPDALARPPGATGLYHVDFEVPTNARSPRRTRSSRRPASPSLRSTTS